MSEEVKIEEFDAKRDKVYSYQPEDKNVDQLNLLKSMERVVRSISLTEEIEI